MKDMKNAPRSGAGFYVPAKIKKMKDAARSLLNAVEMVGKNLGVSVLDLQKGEEEYE